MESKNKPADVTPGVAKEQLAKGKSVVDPRSPMPSDGMASYTNLADTLKRGVLYKIYDLQQQGGHFARLKVNRELDPKQVKKMKESIKSIGGIVMPLTVLPARQISSEFEIVDEEGKDVDAENEDINNMLVIIDGQHRFKAYSELCKEGATTFHGYVMLPLIESKQIDTLLSEINTSVTPLGWNRLDYFSRCDSTTQGAFYRYHRICQKACRGF